MHLGLRLLFAFVAITGLAAFFVLRIFVTEIKPSVGEVMEDLMVDTANLLAEVAAPELQGLPAGAALQDGALTAAVRRYVQRPVDMQIWGLNKTTLDLRVLLTDANGRVVFDSGTPPATGQDYSQWRDVRLTLRGDYGARTSRDEREPQASVMHVAAPVKAGGRILGALVVAKPLSTIAPFVERAERKLLWAGFVLLGLSLAIGVAVTLWTVHSVRRLQRYALQVGDTAAASGPRRPPPPPPALAGELGELARAMDGMRQRLEGREQLEHHVRALTHELKSPLAAIRGAAELLHEDLAPADRTRFVHQVDDQTHPAAATRNPGSARADARSAAAASGRADGARAVAPLAGSGRCACARRPRQAAAGLVQRAGQCHHPRATGQQPGPDAASAAAGACALVAARSRYRCARIRPAAPGRAVLQHRRVRARQRPGPGHRAPGAVAAPW